MRDNNCPYCGKSFADENALWQHAQAKHKGKDIDVLRLDHDAEPSMAELSIEAMWNDDPSLDGVREMFPDNPRYYEGDA